MSTKNLLEAVRETLHDSMAADDKLLEVLQELLTAVRALSKEVHAIPIGLRKVADCQ